MNFKDKAFEVVEGDESSAAIKDRERKKAIIGKYRKKCFDIRAGDSLKFEKVIIDMEMTGLDTETDEILQISIISEDNNILFDSYIKPYANTTWDESIHHITPEMVKNAPYLHQVIIELKSILNGDNLLVGWGMDTDLLMISDRIGVDYIASKNYFDVSDLKEFRLGGKRIKLQTAAESIGYFYESHNSLEDARAVLKCLKYVEGIQKTFYKMVQFRKTYKHLKDISNSDFYNIENVTDLKYDENEVESVNTAFVKDIENGKLRSEMFDAVYCLHHYSKISINCIGDHYEIMGYGIAPVEFFVRRMLVNEISNRADSVNKWIVTRNNIVYGELLDFLGLETSKDILNMLHITS